jgi:hypothetical protein
MLVKKSCRILYPIIIIVSIPFDRMKTDEDIKDIDIMSFG